uniref:Ig-like domain-containing protein n=1 Tax=Anopheles dirus TaxID=7168 RepID=A0A182N594_9DIPT
MMNLNQPPQTPVDLEPEFEGTIQNISSPTGREAILTCAVKNLGRYKVGWLRASDQTVLALQGRVVTHNSRISVVHEDFRTWRLRIRQLRESDRGCYMCQINASPMKKQIGCIDVQVAMSRPCATLGALVGGICHRWKRFGWEIVVGQG